ncbi:MAG: DNA polymerase III subunit alpha [Armatimonadota bacterium]|nr:DNA polymerase III subunit alpha [Armatimonadota bacterium]MDR7469534.1 DNA polymerase III subunit alpha [Armatimonadota bacterium]MDR7473458.1 DNA polymerase III subunit alpha [Armatimonadota bacterium]MDR7539368.1 DNA polymerase III subunit alpha [Armatimonadota bacterium]
MSDPFVHCHLHTEYSLLDGHSRIRPLMEEAVRLGMPAVALTDHGAMYGAIEFFLAAREYGLTPILGVEAYVAPRRLSDRDPKLDANPAHLILLATSTEGYRNLMALTTVAHLEGFYYKPRIDREVLARHSRGLVGSSACVQGEVARAILRDDLAGAREIAAAYRDIFGPGNFFLEVQNHGLPEEARVIQGMLRLARELDLPLLATNDVHYVRPDEADAQDALMCIQMNIGLEQTDKPRMGNVPQFYLKSAEEMSRLFAEIPQAVRTPLEIAERAHVEIEMGRLRLPHFPVPPGETADSYLRRLCEAGLHRLFGRITPEVQARLDHELEIIARTGYAAYFLIVQDFVNFARRQGILTTVRGSAAGSLVLYALGVTDVDPLQYRLPFERFLNLERVTPPDIDVDFMDSRRDEVIRYVIERYGIDHVAQIITFGTMGARQAVRDVGRVMGLPYGEVDRIAKLIPFHASIDEALRADPELARSAQENPQVRRLLDLAQKLEGVARHASTHAAGVIISRDPLIEHVPLQKSTKGDLVMTQYDMNAVEKIGLLKMDFLGLINLTILDTALRIIARTRGMRIDLKAIPLDDQKTYDLLSAGETVGIFQLEGAGMTRYLKELRPSRIEDIMAMVALFRPGPMANIPAYIRRKHGREPITYLHPSLEPVLRETYGVMVYQEDVMAVAQAAAGYTLAEADVLRYAVGKKIKDKLEAQREKFIAGCRRRGIPRRTADQLWEQFEPFARYGFNRAHAACYGLIAYYTAYLKANYPVEYMTAVLTHEAQGQDWMAKVALAVAEARRMGIRVLPPDVNASEENFSVEGEAIRFGLSAVKHVGAGAVQEIIRARQEGPFSSLTDLCARVDGRVVNKRVLESLIKAGALDSLGQPRAQLLASLDQALAAAQRVQRLRDSPQQGLFALDGPAVESPPLLPVEEFSDRERLAMEKEMLGLYISDHPLAHLQEDLAARVSLPIGQLSEVPDRTTVTVGGIVTALKRTTTRSGSVMAFLTLEDLTGAVEVIVFPKTYEQNAFLLKKDAVLVVRGRADVAEQQVKVLAESLFPLAEAPVAEPLTEAEPLLAEDAPGADGNGGTVALAPEETPPEGPGGPVLHVRLPVHLGAEALERLRVALERHPGHHPLVLHLVRDDRETVVRSQEVRVRADPALAEDLESEFGAGTAWVEEGDR